MPIVKTEASTIMSISGAIVVVVGEYVILVLFLDHRSVSVSDF